MVDLGISSQKVLRNTGDNDTEGDSTEPRLDVKLV